MTGHYLRLATDVRILRDYPHPHLRRAVFYPRHPLYPVSNSGSCDAVALMGVVERDSIIISVGKHPHLRPVQMVVKHVHGALGSGPCVCPPT